MSDDPRLRTVITLVTEHVGSPSLRHIRNAEQIHKLAKKILRRLDGQNEPWRKWPSARDTLIRAAVDCWIPLVDLHAALTELPGPPLTVADVTGRLLALHGEGLDRPDDSLRSDCETLDAREKAARTELAAIVAIMKEWMGVELSRRFTQEWEERNRRRAEMREAAEQTFLSGGDCKWTQIGTSPALYCRANGRLYRLSRMPDKKLEMHRVTSIEDTAGRLIGRYHGRPDATKAVEHVAYQPEPRW